VPALLVTARDLEVLGEVELHGGDVALVHVQLVARDALPAELGVDRVDEQRPHPAAARTHAHAQVDELRRGGELRGA
jgi:hypothetical protein